MARMVKNRTPKIGLPPGTLVHIGAARTEKPAITVFDYDGEQCREFHPDTVKECAEFRSTPTVTWINVDGVHDVSVVEELGTLFDVHPLVLEDVASTSQRPKADDYDSHLFVVVKMLHLGPEKRTVAAEQVSLILGDGFVLSFQEAPGDVFEPIRERIREGKGRIRQMRSDYLLYCLLDSILDNYFTILELFGDKIELLEDQAVGKPTPEFLKRVYRLKREMVFLRKNSWPLREMVGSLGRGESPLMQEETSMYVRDLYDHTLQIIDTVELLRDAVSGMMDIYLSSMSNRMNEVMKTLTIIATVFIPLTFIAGVYGMNFKHMPELSWPWAYPFVLTVMAALGVGMLLYFRKRYWR